MKVIKKNPAEILIINPDEDCDRAEAWKKVQDFYEDPDDAIRAYVKMYPDSIIKRSIEDFEQTAELKQAIKNHIDFHGEEPEEVIGVDIPGLPETDQVKFLNVLGYAPADSYIADGASKTSKKAGITYVHPYGERTGVMPLKVMTPDGQTILTVLGEFSVKKKKGDKMAWIHD